MQHVRCNSPERFPSAKVGALRGFCTIPRVSVALWLLLSACTSRNPLETTATQRHPSRSLLVFSHEITDGSETSSHKHCYILIKREGSPQSLRLRITGPKTFGAAAVHPGRYRIMGVQCARYHATKALHPFRLTVRREEVGYLGHFHVVRTPTSARLTTSFDSEGFAAIVDSLQENQKSQLVLAYNGQPISLAMTSGSHTDLIWEPTAHVKHPMVIGGEPKKCVTSLPSPFFLGTLRYHLSFLEGDLSGLRLIQSSHPYSEALDACIQAELAKMHVSHPIDAELDFGL